MSVETRHVKYVFADVVDFTVNRTVQAQMEIVGALNGAFREAVDVMETIFLPTGDGICAAITQPNASHDAHLRVALSVISQMKLWSENQAEDRKCRVRFGLNESVDCMVLDINNRDNIAGAGINQAQRLMAMADGNQIVVGRAAFDNLRVWDEYVNSFRALRAESKHGIIIEAFQYLGPANGLNVEIPRAVRDTDPIDLQFADATRTGGTNAYTAAAYRAVDAWKEVVEGLSAKLLAAAKIKDNEKKLEFLADKLTPLELEKQVKASQEAFGNYLQCETLLTHEIRRFGGSMWKSLSAEHSLQVIRHRAKLLREIALDAFGIDDE